jgi:DNA-binding XRE family transcriptional regulator
MDHWEFLKWRRTLGYTQDEAGEKLGVSRGTIQHWERDVTRIPQAMEMACQELTRRWKQRPDFGPVSLVYADGRASSPTSFLHCELHSNNDAAIQQALRLSETPNFVNPHIMEDGAGVIWTTAELVGECARRQKEPETGRKTPEARPGPEQGAAGRRPPKRSRPSGGETG